MLINRLLSHLALGAGLLLAGAALPAAAQAHDGDYRNHWSRYQDDDGYRWEHRRHWGHRDFYPSEERRQESCRIVPRAYYRPAHDYRRSDEGVTIIYGDRW